jgi:hypothetical protein
LKETSQIDSQTSPIKDRKNTINASPLSAFKLAQKIKMKQSVFGD